MPDKPPIWYKEEEIRVWLLRKGFYRMGLDAQITFITTHLQLAFEKGYSIAERKEIEPTPEVLRALGMEGK